MFNWLNKLLQRLSTDESGILLNPAALFFRDEGEEGGDGGDGDSGDEGDEDEGGTDGDGHDDDDGGGFDDDETRDKGGDDDAEDTGSEGIDDAKALAYLKSKGIEFDNLDNLKNLNDNLSGVTTKHQSAKDMLKGLKTALGEDFDATLAKGMKGISGEDQGGESDFEEPAHFKQMTPETKNQVASTFGFHFKKQMPGIIDGVVQGVLKHLDRQQYIKDNPDHEQDQPMIDAFAKKHGITSRSSETMKFIKGQLKQATQEALDDLAGNEGDGLKVLGKVPSPHSSDRVPGGELKEVVKWGDEKSERAYLDRLKKRTAAKNRK